MRRQSIFFSLISFIVLILGSCTLSMEEWVMPEEERGVYEPYTVKTDVVDLTYQFNEGVKPITDNVMQYFVTVQSDTILYFTDNCPKEWLPEVGGYVQIGCTLPFPDGYAGRVLEKTRANGQIRLVTTHATFDEIFKDFKYVSDFEYAIPVPEDYDPDDYYVETGDTIMNVDYSDPDDLPYDVVSDETTDSIETASVRHVSAPVASRRPSAKKRFTDYTFIKDQSPELYEKMMKEHFPVHYSRMLSRGTDDEDNKDTHSEETMSISINLNPLGINFDFNGKKFGGSVSKLPTATEEAITKYLQEQKQGWKKYAQLNGQYEQFGELSGSLSYTSVKTTTIHSEVDKKNKIEKQWTDTRETQTISANAGYNRNGTIGYSEGTHGKINSGIAKAINAHNAKKSPAQKIVCFPFADDIYLYGPLALKLKIDFSIGVILDFNVAGTLSYTTVTESRTGYIYENEVKTPIDSGEKPQKSGNWNADIRGTLTFGGYANLYVGLEVLESIGGGLDFNVQGGIKASVGTDNSIPGSQYCNYAGNNYIKPFFGYSAKGVVYVTIFGLFDVSKVEIPINKFSADDIVTTKWPLEPYFPSAMGYLDAKVVESGYQPYFTGSYKLEGLGLNPLNKRYKPMMRLYEWAKQTKFVLGENKGNLSFFGDNPVLDITATNGDEMRAGRQYKFESPVPEIGKYSSYIAIPCLYDPVFKSYLLFPEHIRQVEVGTPKLEVLKVVQTKGRALTLSERKEFGIHTNKVADYNLYEYAVVVQLRNGTKIKNVKLSNEITYNPKGEMVKMVFSEFPSTYYSGCYIYYFRFASNNNAWTDEAPFSVEIVPSFEDTNGKEIECDKHKLDIDLLFNDVKVNYKGEKFVSTL